MRACKAARSAILYPSTIVCGCILLLTSCSASLRSSAARTHTDVVPSPTSSSWTLLIFTSTFAAALSKAMDLRIVAPSLVTVMPPVDADCRILSYSQILIKHKQKGDNTIPLGPSVLLTRSPTAIAPTKEDYVRRGAKSRERTSRAFSPRSSVASSLKIWTGARDYKSAFVVVHQATITVRGLQQGARCQGRISDQLKKVRKSTRHEGRTDPVLRV